jgi:hypothetical protein
VRIGEDQVVVLTATDLDHRPVQREVTLPSTIKKAPAGGFSGSPALGRRQPASGGLLLRHAKPALPTD